MIPLFIRSKRFSFIWFLLAIYIVLSLKFTNRNVLIKTSSYQMENTSFLPHLPIEFLTKNRQRFLQLPNKTKKVVLLGNKFFNDRTWSLKSLEKQSSMSNFSELFCSFLDDFCEITTDIDRFSQADAIVYHIRDPIDRSEYFIKHRRLSQRFVFALWETPINTPNLHSFNEFFNWTMTYRFDSHIFSPYYFSNSFSSKDKRWFEENLLDYRNDQEILVSYENIRLDQKKGTAAALISNCGEKSQQRWQIIKELQKYIDVTIYGRCGQPCPPSIDCRVYLADNYYFLLTLENSSCRDYITEKFFSAITLPIVPIISGETDYTRFIPSSGFIDIRHYSSLVHLAEDLRRIRSNSTLYQNYFRWKKDFFWSSFTTYMSSFCDLCLRLHLDSDVSVLDNIQNWWHDQTCQ